MNDPKQRKQMAMDKLEKIYSKPVEENFENLERLRLSELSEYMAPRPGLLSLGFQIVAVIVVIVIGYQVLTPISTTPTDNRISAIATVMSIFPVLVIACVTLIAIGMFFKIW